MLIYALIRSQWKCVSHLKTNAITDLGTCRRKICDPDSSHNRPRCKSKCYREREWYQVFHKARREVRMKQNRKGNHLIWWPSVAEIEVTVKNCGPEAFKPELYGESVIVVRRITKEGQSSYKIKSGSTGRIVSTKREELVAMCDQMQLQVDNPMNVLTQGTWFFPVHHACIHQIHRLCKAVPLCLASKRKV